MLIGRPTCGGPDGVMISTRKGSSRSGKRAHRVDGDAGGLSECDNNKVPSRLLIHGSSCFIPSVSSGRHFQTGDVLLREFGCRGRLPALRINSDVDTFRNVGQNVAALRLKVAL